MASAAGKGVRRNDPQTSVACRPRRSAASRRTAASASMPTILARRARLRQACASAPVPIPRSTMVRAAGGKQMRIIGSTYPDVELGLWVHPTLLGGPKTMALVPGSLSSFRDDINPGLKKAYDTVDAAFVDVTKATGAYGPFVATTDANADWGQPCSLIEIVHAPSATTSNARG